MAVTPHTYSRVALSAFTKKIDLSSDTIKVMLLSAYTVGSTQDSAQFVSDVLAVATEATGTGYSAGGVAVVSPTFTLSGHVYTLTSTTNPSWASSTITASYAVFYDSTPGTDATNPVLCYWDFGGAVSSSGSAFTLTINASGILTLTAA